MTTIPIVFFSGFGDHLDLHVLTHSFPTRRSSDLLHVLQIALGGEGGDHGQLTGAIIKLAAPPDIAQGVLGDALCAKGIVLAQRFEHRLRSEEHTSELQSLMRISYAAFCLKKKHTYERQSLMHIPYAFYYHK